MRKLMLFIFIMVAGNMKSQDIFPLYGTKYTLESEFEKYLQEKSQIILSKETCSENSNMFEYSFSSFSKTDVGYVFRFDKKYNQISIHGVRSNIIFDKNGQLLKVNNAHNQYSFNEVINILSKEAFTALYNSQHSANITNSHLELVYMQEKSVFKLYYKVTGENGNIKFFDAITGIMKPKEYGRLLTANKDKTNNVRNQQRNKLMNVTTQAIVIGPTVTCDDGVQNGDEEGVDCGGPDCPPCPPVNIINCTTWGNPTLNAKIYPYFPDQSQSIVEIQVPSTSAISSCQTFQRRLNNYTSLSPLDLCCANFDFNGLKKFCYDPFVASEKEGYSQVFSLFKGNEFLSNSSIGTLLGGLLGNYTLQYDSGVSSYPLVNGNLVSFGNDGDFYSGSDLFYVTMAFSKAALGSANFSGQYGQGLIWDGFATYMAQSYIGSAMQGTSDGVIKTNVSCNDLNTEPSNKLAAMLTAVEGSVGREISHKIIVNATMEDLGNAGYSSVELNVEALYNETVLGLYNQGEITKQELCAIKSAILGYYDCITLNLSGANTMDLYIKDTHAGDTDIWQNANNGEDVGNEPNNDSQQFWISPSIWNSVASGGTTHQNPSYQGANVDNYMYVKVHDRGCSENVSGELKVYMSAASTWHQWPTHWENFTIFHNGQNVVAGKLIGTVNLASASPDADGVRTYEIPYVPFNPDDFDGYGSENDGSKMKVCVLGRIVSAADPMYSEQNGDIGYNLKQNNNVAMKNMTIDDNDGNLVNDDGGGIIIVRGNIDDISDQFPVIKCGPYKFKIEILEAIKDLGFNADSTFFEDGDLEILLDDSFMEEWKNGDLQGNGFVFTGNNKIKVTNKHFEISNIKLKYGRDYPIHVRYTYKKSRVMVGFNFAQLTMNGCYTGGEFYQLSNVNTENRSKKSDVQNSVSHDLELYPNPAGNTLSIKNNSTYSINSIEFYNNQGTQIVLKQNNNLLENIFDLNNIESGIYLVKITFSDGIVTTRKVVKK